MAQLGRAYPARALIGRGPLPVAGGLTEADGAASGLATVTAVGAAEWLTVAASAGVAIVQAVSVHVVAADGASSGLAAASGVGAAYFAGVGNAAGVATASADGENAASPFVEADAAAAGVATVTGVSGATAGSAGASSGVATATASGAARVAGVGAASGAATGSASSSTTVGASAAAAGVATIAGAGAWRAAAVGAAAGTSTGAADGEAAPPFVVAGLILVSGERGTVTSAFVESASVPTAAGEAHSVAEAVDELELVGAGG